MEHSSRTGEAGQSWYYSRDPDTDRIAELYRYIGGCAVALYVPGIDPYVQGMIDRGEMDPSVLVTGSILDGHRGVLIQQDPEGAPTGDDPAAIYAWLDEVVVAPLPEGVA